MSEPKQPEENGCTHVPRNLAAQITSARDTEVLMGTSANNTLHKIVIAGTLAESRKIVIGIEGPGRGSSTIFNPTRASHNSFQHEIKISTRSPHGPLKIFTPGPLGEPHKSAKSYGRHRNTQRVLQDFESETPKSILQRAFTQEPLAQHCRDLRAGGWGKQQQHLSKSKWSWPIHEDPHDNQHSWTWIKTSTWPTPLDLENFQGSQAIVWPQPYFEAYHVWGGY